MRICFLRIELVSSFEHLNLFHNFETYMAYDLISPLYPCQGFLYHFPTPFTLSAGALSGGDRLTKISSGGVRLTIFGPEGPKNRRRRRRFRKFWQTFEKKWPKNAIKIIFLKFWVQKIFSGHPS